MDKRLLWRFLLAWALLVVVLPLVAAADPLSQALGPFAGFNVGQVYERFGTFLDFIAFAVLFVGAAQAGLKDVFKDQQVVPVIIGVILAVTASVFANRMGFRLSDLGPYALVIGLIIIGIAVYRMLNGMGFGGVKAGAWAFVIAWALFSALIDKWIPDQGLLRTVFAMGHLLFLIGFVFLIIGAFGWVTQAVGGGGEVRVGQAPTADQSRAQEQERAAEQAREEAVRGLQLEEHDFGQLQAAEDAGIANLADAAQYLQSAIDLIRQVVSQRGTGPDTWRQIGERLTRARNDILNAIRIEGQIQATYEEIERITPLMTTVFARLNNFRDALRRELARPYAPAGAPDPWAAIGPPAGAPPGMTPAQTAIDNRVTAYITSLRRAAFEQMQRVTGPLRTAVQQATSSETAARSELNAGISALQAGNPREALRRFGNSLASINTAIRNLGAARTLMRNEAALDAQLATIIGNTAAGSADIARHALNAASIP